MSTQQYKNVCLYAGTEINLVCKTIWDILAVKKELSIVSMLDYTHCLIVGSDLRVMYLTTYDMTDDKEHIFVA